MNYAKLLDRLFHVNLHGGVKLGLTNMHLLSKILGLPETKFASVHVAGTNGKGSVATKIAKGLESAGFKTGLYTSPHISCFRERIRINGVMIDEKESARWLNQIFQIIENEKIPATFFEIATALAFAYFAEQKADIVILETGLGGKLDATNIVSPRLSIITSISLEHTEILGTTIEMITAEKGGIIKKDTPTLIGPRVSAKQIGEICEEKKSPLTIVQGQYVDFEAENCAIAKKALEMLGIEKPAIQKGLKALPPCRFEIVHKNTSDHPETIILDVAHNPDGLKHLFDRIKKYYPQQQLRVLFGLSKTKDLKGCIKILKQNNTHFHIVEAPNGRGVPQQELKELLLQENISDHFIHIEGSIKENLLKALHHSALSKEILVICGSFFIMDEARQTLEIKEDRDPYDTNERFSQVVHG